MVRVRLDLGYDGTHFSGWAQQPDRRTVEGVLRVGLGRVLRLDPAPTLVTAGRTDAGVHARGAVAHVDLPRSAWGAMTGRDGAQPDVMLRRRLRGVLPDDVVVHRVALTSVDFDARFSAIYRRYRYRLCDRVDELDPLRRFDTVAWRRPLDLDAMQQASSQLIGLADFAAFCRARPGATTIRCLTEFSWARGAQDGILRARVVADAFCHSMVRALVGAIVVVGEGRQDPGWPAQVLRAGRRDPGVPVMPAHGLTLDEVGYPVETDYAARSAQARAIRTLPLVSSSDDGIRNSVDEQCKSLE